MKRIALIHSGPAYKSEIYAYQHYFSKAGFEVDLLKTAPESSSQEYDVEWYFMGLNGLGKQSDAFIIHEYTCSSNPPFSTFKNKIKTWFNRKPHARIFGSVEVQSHFNFKDSVPVFYRDAGISQKFFEQSAYLNKPTYDFVYCGSMDKIRAIELLLEKFILYLKGHTLLLVGNAPKQLVQQFGDVPGIHFTGYVPYSKIPEYLAKARYGLNFIPSVIPLVHQRPLKLIEYCAIGLKVISTDYDYVRHFEKKRAARFFKIKPDWSNFSWEKIEQFNYRTPDVSDLGWEMELERSGIKDFLLHHFD